MRGLTDSTDSVSSAPSGTDSGRLHISHPLATVSPIAEPGAPQASSRASAQGVILVLSAVLTLFIAALLLLAVVSSFVFVTWSAQQQHKREEVLRAEAAENLRQLQDALSRAETELAGAPAESK